MVQGDAISWLVETVLPECVDVTVHLDGMKPLLNAVIVQWTNTVLNCLVVIIRPAVGMCVPINKDQWNYEIYIGQVRLTALLECLNK